MTDKTETAKPGVSALASVITDLGFTAAFTWVAGIALNVGFGVSVPFTPVWLLALVALWGSQMMVGQLATVWHGKRVKADISLLAASMAAQDMIHERHASGLDKFLAKLDEPTDTDNGAYL